ncbi:MAG: hypothetical protein IPO13_11005 [Rhodocyclaceae bacterium]|nr:hypothetical protein [Rhodocyclaceae bacterium]
MTTPVRARQQGFVLVIALVIMVVMTLSAVAMITSLRGGISASGNISFRQAATRAADVAADGAYQWIQARMATPTGLDNGIAPANTAGATTTARYYATMAGADAGCKKMAWPTPLHRKVTGSAIRQPAPMVFRAHQKLPDSRPATIFITWFIAWQIRPACRVLPHSACHRRRTLSQRHQRPGAPKTRPAQAFAVLRRPAAAKSFITG